MTPGGVVHFHLQNSSGSPNLLHQNQAYLFRGVHMREINDAAYPLSLKNG